MGINRRSFVKQLGLKTLVPKTLVLKGMGVFSLLALNNCSADKPLNIGSHVWPGYEFMFLARDMGWLRDKNLKLRETPSAAHSMKLLASGKLDGAALTIEEVLQVRTAGIPLEIVAVFDISSGADMVLTRPGITRLHELKGKRIGVENSALGSLVMHQLLQAAGLTIAQIESVYVENEHHLNAFEEKSLDALITYEPEAGLLLAQGMNLIFDSRQMPDMIFDVLAIRPGLVSSQSMALTSLIAGNFIARQYFQTNTQDAVYRMAGRLQLSASEVLTAFRGLELPTLRSNRKLLSKKNSRLAKSSIILSKLMFAENLLPIEDPLDNLLSAAYLPKKDS